MAQLRGGLALISIHALREEGDVQHCFVLLYAITFLSTPSARRATVQDVSRAKSSVISIHALREEGDCLTRILSSDFAYFYPRPPRGGRRDVVRVGDVRLQISIHALREEGDNQGILCCRGGQIFLSTPSARRATRLWGALDDLDGDFYPRPPRGGRRRCY